MAVVTNTFQTTSAVGNREQLSNIVSRITPEDTPIYSMIEHGKLSSVHPEWEIDVLRAPAANAQLEGDEYSFNAITPPVRVGNYSQIFRDSWAISESQNATDNAGSVEKTAEAKIKAGIAVRKDVELSIVANSATVAGATRVSGGLPSWLTTNDDRGTGGADGGFNQTTKLTVAETTGTQRRFNKAMTDSTMSKLYSSGGTPRKLVVSPFVKSEFVTFMSDTNVASFRYAASSGSKNTIVGTADIYEGPFGKIDVIPNRVMATSAAVARRAFFIDPEYISFDWLRPIAEDKDVAKTGDAKKGVIIGEGCLRVKNEAALAVAADLFGLSAAT